uniref:Putative ovule protein n=1 Tax=Solanum chacoense TaxID=4108 RepID=A0A0V0HR86_SOLCH
MLFLLRVKNRLRKSLYLKYICTVIFLLFVPYNSFYFLSSDSFEMDFNNCCSDMVYSANEVR